MASMVLQVFRVSTKYEVQYIAYLKCCFFVLNSLESCLLHITKQPPYLRDDVVKDDVIGAHVDVSTQCPLLGASLWKEARVRSAPVPSVWYDPTGMSQSHRTHNTPQYSSTSAAVAVAAAARVYLKQTKGRRRW